MKNKIDEAIRILQTESSRLDSLEHENETLKLFLYRCVGLPISTEIINSEQCLKVKQGKFFIDSEHKIKFYEQSSK